MTGHIVGCAYGAAVFVHCFYYHSQLLLLMDSIWIGKMLSSFKIPKNKPGVTSASLLLCGTKAQHIGKYCTYLRLFEWKCRASRQVTNLERVFEHSQFRSVSVHCLLTYEDSGQWKWSLKQSNRTFPFKVRLRRSGMWCCVAWGIGTSVSKAAGAFIFRWGDG